MSREIRRVPLDWVHPRRADGHRYIGQTEVAYQPMVDEPYRAAIEGWISDYRRWESGDDPDRAEHPDLEYWDWAGGPPDPAYHRPDWDPATMTAYQVYETVSEGTPISPVLIDRAALIDWLVNDGSGMGIGGEVYQMDPAQAERFANHAWAPSMVMDHHGLRAGVEAI